MNLPRSKDTRIYFEDNSGQVSFQKVENPRNLCGLTYLGNVFFNHLKLNSSLEPHLGCQKRDFQSIFLMIWPKNGHKYAISYILSKECNLIETKYAVMIVHPFHKASFSRFYMFLNECLSDGCNNSKTTNSRKLQVLEMISRK